MGYEGASSQFKTLSIATKATAKQLFLAEWLESEFWPDVPTIVLCYYFKQGHSST